MCSLISKVFGYWILMKQEIAKMWKMDWYWTSSIFSTEFQHSQCFVNEVGL